MMLKKMIAVLLCSVILAGCGTGGARNSQSAAAETSTSVSASAEAEKSGDYEENEFAGIKFLINPEWKMELSDDKRACSIYTDNENVTYIILQVAKESIVSDNTEEGIYQSMEVFLGENDKDSERLKFDNGTPYISYYSDFGTEHAYNSIFHTKEGLFAFGMQLIGDIGQIEENKYVEAFRDILASMKFEEAEYKSMSEK